MREAANHVESAEIILESVQDSLAFLVDVLRPSNAVTLTQAGAVGLSSVLANIGDDVALVGSRLEQARKVLTGTGVGNG